MQSINLLIDVNKNSPKLVVFDFFIDALYMPIAASSERVTVTLI